MSKQYLYVRKKITVILQSGITKEANASFACFAILLFLKIWKMEINLAL